MKNTFNTLYIYYNDTFVKSLHKEAQQKLINQLIEIMKSDKEYIVKYTERYSMNVLKNEHYCQLQLEIKDIKDTK